MRERPRSGALRCWLCRHAIAVAPRDVIPDFLGIHALGEGGPGLNKGGCQPRQGLHAQNFFRPLIMLDFALIIA